MLLSERAKVTRNELRIALDTCNTRHADVIAAQQIVTQSSHQQDFVVELVTRPHVDLVESLDGNSGMSVKSAKHNTMVRMGRSKE